MYDLRTPEEEINNNCNLYAMHRLKLLFFRYKV